MNNVAILKALLEKGWKQAALAKEIGVEQASISRWLKGVEIKAANEKRLHEFAQQEGVISDESGSQERKNNTKARRDFIDEIDVTAGLGGGGLAIVEQTANDAGMTFSAEVVRDFWRLPQWVLNRFNAQASHIKAFPSQGDSMAPTIDDGDVVFADTRHRVPSPPGVYVLADEFGGVVVKRLEIVSRPRDEEVVVKVISDNLRHSARELLLDELNIIGRYVGRFTI